MSMFRARRRFFMETGEQAKPTSLALRLPLLVMLRFGSSRRCAYSLRSSASTTWLSAAFFGRRRRLRERASPQRSHLHRRCVSTYRRLFGNSSHSALSAFRYLGVPHPEKFAAASILIIGLLNLLGPKQTGSLAFLVSVPTAIVVVVLGLFSLPHLGEAIGHLQPLHGGFWQNWAGFVGIVLALSGVEAIANATGVMKLDPGSTEAHPSVVKTSTPAILMVMIEVCVFTALLGLAPHALDGLQVANGDVNAPGAEGVRDYMLRYMGQIFVGGALGPAFGHAFGFIVSIVFGLLLLSAVNTAIVDLIAIQFLMARDRELPSIFHRLNKWGLPTVGMLLATVV